ncbi:hypothetical protein [Kitasatospora sp. NPDC001547]|uniref:hypothetical protein n=1 Tax=Kitasatospora sp. NPDC001547 TaxID=3364015 RepID=UPI00369E44DB
MLTITTTRNLDALRQRAAQAETALTDTNRRLETLLEQPHRTCQEPPATRTDLAAARDGLAAALQLADEAMAREARTKRVCDLMVKDASSQLAARDRTIAELRAELEQARTGQPVEPELPDHTVLRFRTRAGGLAVVIGKPGTGYTNAEYSWRCLACGDGNSCDYDDHLVDRMRRMANKHAGECWAVPATTDGTTKKKKKKEESR